MYRLLLISAISLGVFAASETPPCGQGATMQTPVFNGGTADNFAGGTEPTSQSPLLAKLSNSFAPFDETKWDRKFGHTLTGLPCSISGATLELKIRGLSSLTSNDTLGLQATGGAPAFRWGRYIRDLVSGNWGTGVTAVLSLDLNNLPLASGGSFSLLSQLETDGYLDVYIQDDTAVDYIKLTVQHCVGEDCNNNGIDDSCEAAGSFTCFGGGVYTLESGQCCANLQLGASYDGACSGEVTITNDYDSTQGGSLRACFDPGVTTVTFTMFSSTGQIEECAVTVDVRDVTPPTISFCPRQK